MRNILLALSIMLMLNSCYNVNESNTPIPENIIPKETLIEVLTDIQLVEAGFSVSENRMLEKDLKPQYYNAVLDNYEITLEQLRENVNYYQSTPKVMEEIYESVLANLSKIQSDVIADIEERERIADSIAQAADSLVADTLVDPSKNDTLPTFLIKNK